MKTYNVTKRISSQAKKQIERILENNEKYKKAYFFRPSCNASGRRKNEIRFTNSNPDVTFIKGTDTVIVSMSYSESCKNVYYSLNVSVNGESKNISAVKKFLKK